MTGRGKSYEDEYGSDAMLDLRFGSSKNEFMDYVHDLHGYIRELETKIDSLLIDGSGSKRNEIDKLLAKDKNAIIEALENGEDSVKIGGKKFDTITAVEKYKMELEEVITRVEDQRLVGSKGNVVQTKRCLCDFIILLDKFTGMYDSVSEKIVSLEAKNRDLNLSTSRKDRRIEELEDTAARAIARNDERTNEINTLTIRVADLLREIDELKKPVVPTSLNQKRTIQRK